jgi:hypothetical protein
VTHHALGPTVKLLRKRDGAKTPIAPHGPLGISCHPKQKAKEMVDYSENQWRKYEPRMDTKVASNSRSQPEGKIKIP